MSRIEELIQQLSPDGVEYKMLGEVFEIRNGYTPSKSNPEYWTNGTIPWFRMEDIRQTGRILSDSIQHITPDAVKGGKLFPAYSIIVATTATIGEHALITVDSLANQRFTYLTKHKSFIDRLDMKYFFYYMFIVDEWCKNNTNSASFPSVDMGKFKKYKIPIPPLEVQEEIVRILDKFTQLEAELEAELEARRKQYEFYRNNLLSFEGQNVQWKTLGEIGEFIRGNGLQKKDFTESGVGCIHYGQIYTYYGTFTDKTKSFVSEDLAIKLKKAEHGDLIIATVSENIQDVCKSVVWLGNDEICVSGDSLIFRHNQNPKYIGYCLQTEKFADYKKLNVTGTKVIRLHADKLKKFKIPIPHLFEQERIVNILDKFDALVNDISQGLPAEIEARRKQYEYYRGKLLNFKKKELINGGKL